MTPHTVVMVSWILFLFPFVKLIADAALYENERLEMYHARNYTFPIPQYKPDTEGWTALMNERFAQMAEMPDSGQRYEGYFQITHSAFLTPNFTEHGFGLTKCPDELLAELQKGIHEGLPTAGLEERDAVIPGPHTPLFIDRPDLTSRVLAELHPFVEKWAEMPLVAHQAYGFRLYRNESQLYMHVDRMETHIISFILHIDSSEDAEPWPIFIEDFNGRTHEVILTPGDILFYESSKCFHGRPRPFNGSWYTSVFAHYYPRHGWRDIDHALENHYAVPPHWADDPEGEPIQRKLEMVETSMREPGCPNDWCRTVDTVQWSGPAKLKTLTLPTQQTIPFVPWTGEDEL